MHRYKVAVLGDEGVGKTELSRKVEDNTLTSSLCTNVIRRACTGTYNNKFEDTYQTHVVDIVVDGKISNIKIIDTFPPFNSLQRDIQDYTTLPKDWACEGYLLVYSIASRSSFNRMRLFHNKIMSFKGSSDPVVILVGNKTDLGGLHRKVSPEEGLELARYFDCRFVETSATTSNNVGPAFQDVLQKLNAARREGPKCPLARLVTVKKKKDSECVHQ